MRKNASSMIYLIFFFVMFLAFCAFAVDGTIIFAQRARLQNATEAAALAGASAFKYQGTSTIAEVQTKAAEAFKMWEYNDLENAGAPNVQVNIDKKMVMVTTRMIAQPFFLAFLGTSGIELNAMSAAKSEELKIKSKYPGINWVSAAMVYRRDIIMSDKDELYDTAVLKPVGQNSRSASLDASDKPKLSLIDDKDDRPLSLAPAGRLIVKLPAPIVDKKGPDIMVKEYGEALDGYFVFVGLDNDPAATRDASKTTGPYINYKKHGSNVKWTNISCSGDYDTGLPPYQIYVQGVGNQVKFYGPAYFDIGDSCIGKKISMAKYLAIVDDNDESAFVESNGSYFPAMLYGESSQPTSGVDLDYISVLNHVILIKPKEFVN